MKVDASLYKRKRYSTPDQFLVHLLEKRKIENFLSGFAPFEKVLDVPCGYGRMGSLLKKFCRTLTGCDISQEMLLEVGEGVYDHLVRADIKNLPFPDGSFELVVSIRLFHHLDEEEIKRAMDELLRISSCMILLSFYKPVKIHSAVRKVRGLPPRIKTYEEDFIRALLAGRAEVIRSSSLIPLFHSQHFLLIKKKVSPPFQRRSALPF